MIEFQSYASNVENIRDPLENGERSKHFASMLILNLVVDILSKWAPALFAFRVKMLLISMYFNDKKTAYKLKQSYLRSRHS